jgi:hypothetical protein
MFGSSAAYVTSSLAKVVPATAISVRFAYAAATVALFVYVLGFVTSFWLPEPAEKLPD